MKIASFDLDLTFNNDRINTQVILETSFSKEIRILMKQGQKMKEHKAPFPIIVHILDGAIDFGINGSTLRLNEGNIITLDANIPHDLSALADSIVRLTLSKQDKVKRVEEATKK